MSSQEKVSYAVCMAAKGTPGRMVRIDDEMWAAYGELCDEEGTSRADDIRRHVHARVKAWRASSRKAQLAQIQANARERLAAGNDD